MAFETGRQQTDALGGLAYLVLGNNDTRLSWARLGRGRLVLSVIPHSSAPSSGVEA